MESIKRIREIYQETPFENLEAFIAQYGGDERAGVRQLVGRAGKRMDDYEKECARLEKMKMFEKKYDACTYICGIDEAGRGPLAGPVVAGAVILPKDVKILYLNDSKQLSAAKREMLYDEIMDKAIAAATGVIDCETIDRINILQATYEAMRQAVRKLAVRPQVLLNDAVIIPGIHLPQEKIIKGDARSVSIAAASILAKVTRDRMMVQYDILYPEYGFAKHKGYGTAEHTEAIRKFGPSPIHRKTFIRNIVTPE